MWFLKKNKSLKESFVAPLFLRSRLVDKIKFMAENCKLYKLYKLRSVIYEHVNWINLYLPANTDITVMCGAENIYLSILLCPIYFGGYNESSVALNERFNVPACLGVTDFGASTPVLTFNISISEESVSTCGSSLVVWNKKLFLNSVRQLTAGSVKK